MKHILSFFLVFLSLIIHAQQIQEKSIPYQFTVIRDNAAGQVEDQCQTGTCWSFATISFLESEIIRLGNKAVDLSEMYNVRINYSRKADSYVRFQGKQQFGPGGLAHDVIDVVRDFGILPEAAFSGLQYGAKEYNHSGLDAMLESTVKTVLEKHLNETGNEWKTGVEAMLNDQIGTVPASFDWEGKKYTAASFRDALKINPDDYVSLTSFTHHPFYRSFVLEVPDNWSKGSFYNLPLNEFQEVIDYAIENGFTIAWDADVSEKGFSFEKGMAIMPVKEVKKEEMWTKIVPEVKADQTLRQSEFDSFRTTDDHLMHITGKAKDQNGTFYYIVKNSWGSENNLKGYQYVSQSYMQMKTVSILIHKDAIPKNIRTKLGI